MPIKKYFRGHGEEVMASIRKAHPDYSEERVKAEFYATVNAPKGKTALTGRTRKRKGT